MGYHFSNGIPFIHIKKQKNTYGCHDNLQIFCRLCVSNKYILGDCLLLFQGIDFFKVIVKDLKISIKDIVCIKIKMVAKC